jgi:hypothetical protein
VKAVEAFTRVMIAILFAKVVRRRIQGVVGSRAEPRCISGCRFQEKGSDVRLKIAAPIATCSASCVS